MKISLPALLVLLSGLAFPLHAQKSTPAPAPTLPSGGTPPPEITPAPRPSASPSASSSPITSPSPSPAAHTSSVSSHMRDTPRLPADFRAGVDGLPEADVQEALQLLKSNYIKPDALNEPELARATLQGVFERITPGAVLVPAGASHEPGPFYSEIFEGRIGYLQLGDLSKNALGEFDAALKNLSEKHVKSAVLDIRAMPAGSDFDAAAEVIKRFCAKGRPLFAVKKSGDKNDRLFTSNADPAFQGVLVVLANDGNAGAAEVIAAVLRAQANALIIGETTAGHMFEFADMPLHESGTVLRVAVAEVASPDGKPLAQGGVKPDIAVPMPPISTHEAMRIAREQGVAAVTTEAERVHMNEAALVAGKNPEIDAIAAAQHNTEKPKSPTLDVQLQRALDLETTLSVFESKRAQK